MPFDGFAPTSKDAFAGYSPGTSERFFRAVDRLAQRWHVSPPLSPGSEPQRIARGGVDDEHAVRSLRREGEGALHELFEEELARRARFPYAS
jgi:hypothetical protein